MSIQAPYPFERKRFSYRDEQRSEQALKAFVNRLGLSEEAANSINDDLIDYITDVHLRISWYSQKLRREKSLSYLYITITIALLGIIPVGIFLISNTLSTESALGQFAAILSGLFGVHKGFASWLEQRRVIAGFWKAMADLKEALYDLEDKHRKAGGSVWEDKDLEELRKDLDLGTKFAQRVERKERDEFFKNYKTPKFDLVSTLSSIGKKTEDVTELFISPATESNLLSEKLATELAEELLEAEMEVVQFAFEVNELKKLVDERSKEIENAPADELSALKAGLKELQVKLERAEANLISARAQVVALKSALGITDNS